MAETSSPASPDHVQLDKLGNPGGGDRDNSDVREQDRLLPIANVGRMMKRVLPARAKVSQESKQTIQECCSEFIGFITDQANVMCKQEKRKTINGDDIMRALSCTGFDDYLEPLKVYLAKYRELEDQAKGSGVNIPGAQNCWKKEGGGPVMPTGVQMGLGGAFDGGMSCMPPVYSGVQMDPGGVKDGENMPSIQPDSHQMLAALRY